METFLFPFGFYFECLIALPNVQVSDTTAAQWNFKSLLPKTFLFPFKTKRIADAILFQNLYFSFWLYNLKSMPKPFFSLLKVY